MTPTELSSRALELFEELVESDADPRPGLERIRAEDPALADAVEELLDADAREGLESPWTPASQGFPEPAGGLDAGDRLGPYELVRVLGQGGMGKVWEALRVAGDFEQRVAIKILRQLEPDSAAERRFFFEQEILGKLEHPAISRILDTGRTPHGAPYLVMEYVDGLRIDEYCDRHGLDVRQRVRLVVDICRIVAHAHRNLVIHRDLKPANILVTDAGEPRLLDFGIAKLSADEPDRTRLTVAGPGPMTPEYASPEQLLEQPVTTASDVYSLGVVLYQLLTRQTPFARSPSTATAIGRSTREADEITRPSQALGDSATAPPKTPTAAQRSRPAREIDRDLDNVTLHALRRDPESRYPSIDAFAADLERWLGGFPVAARGDSLVYRGSKFVRRHWIPLAAGALVFASMALATGIATSSAREAREQRILADDHAQRTEMVNRFLVDLLAAPAGRWWHDLEHKGPDTRVKDVIKEAADKLEVDLESAPLQRATLHQTLNDTYLALRMFAPAEQQVRRALEIRRRELGPLHPAVAESTYYLASTLKGQGELVDAIDTYRAAIDLERQLPEPTGNLPHALVEAAGAAVRIGLDSEVEGWLSEAIRGSEAGDSRFTGYFLSMRALRRAERGRLKSAAEALAEVERWFAVNASEVPGPVSLQYARTGFAWLRGDLDRAEAVSAEPATWGIAQWRSQVLFDLGRYDEALELLEASKARWTGHLLRQVLLARLELVRRRDSERCLELAEPELEREESWSRGPSWYLAEARSAVAACLLARGRAEDVERAERLLRAAQQTLDAVFDQPTPLHRRLAVARSRLPTSGAAPRTKTEPRLASD